MPLRLTRREGRWIVAAVATAFVAARLLAKAPFLQHGSLAIQVATWVAFAVAADLAVCALCVASCNARRRADGGGARKPGP